MTPVAFFIDVTHVERILLVISLLLIVLITELLNTAIEKLCDHVSAIDIHLLIGRAKDIGSAAVFVSLVLACFTWISTLVKQALCDL